MPLRFDRSLTLSVFRPFHRAGSRGSRNCVPILMYHSVSDGAEAGVGPYYRVATSPQRFAEQMQWLRDAGWTGVSLETALTSLDSGTQNGANGPRPVAITFDDGFRDFHTAAWPVLQRHGFTATMYLPTAFIGSERKSFNGRECLTWNEVRELRKHGIRFGSHTVNHPKLHQLPGDAIAAELSISRTQLEQELGEAITSFAYPYAFPQEDRGFTGSFTALLRAQGYLTCATTVIGRFHAGDDPFRLRRLPVNSADDEAFFKAKLNGAYDWLAVPQNLVRHLKAGARRFHRRAPRPAHAAAGQAT